MPPKKSKAKKRKASEVDGAGTSAAAAQERPLSAEGDANEDPPAEEGVSLEQRREIALNSLIQTTQGGVSRERQGN